MTSDRSYVYLVEPSRDSALFGWQAALAGRESARANVVLLGTSTVEGYPLTNFDRTPAQQLARALRAKFPTSGLGSSGGRGRIGIPNQGLSPALPSPFTFFGGTFDPTTYNAAPTRHMGANHTCWVSNTNGNKITFRMKLHETSLDLVHIATSGGHATGGYYKINGGAAVNFSTQSSTATVTNLRINVAQEPSDEFSIDGGSPNSGALIEIGCTGSGYLILDSVITYASDESSGIMVHGVGHSGYKASDFSAVPTTDGGWRNSIANLNPDVIVIELGRNDAAANSAATFSTGLVQLVSSIRSITGPIATCPILLAAPYNAKGGLTFVDAWEDYVAAMRTIALVDPLIAFVNEGDRMPASDALASFGLYHTDHVHGNANGKAYSLQAHLLAEALSYR